MTRTQLTTAYLRELPGQLPARYLAVLPHLARARVLTAAHLDRLLTNPVHSDETTARIRRRIMARLCHLGLVTALDRRIGGVRAGSAGHTYTLTSAGHVFLALLNGEPTPPRIRYSRTPGPLFLHHALAISGIYVDLIEHSRGGEFQVAQFLTEPHCWHPTGNAAHLRPDAYTVLRAATHADCWWLEIDQSTESPPRLRAKARAYRDHLTSGGIGPDGVPPHVLFTAPDQQRAAAVRSAVSGTDAAMFAMTTHHEAAGLLAAELHAEASESGP